MNDRTFVYATHIGATPEKPWQALTDNAFIGQYWEGEWRIESDWKAGSASAGIAGVGSGPRQRAQTLHSSRRAGRNQQNVPPAAHFAEPRPARELESIWHYTDNGELAATERVDFDRAPEDRWVTAEAFLPIGMA